jgi:putative addiction module CopG family antidote
LRKDCFYHAHPKHQPVSPPLADFVKRQVESGNFRNKSDVLKVALEAYQQAEEERQQENARHFEALIEEGLEDSKAGRLTTISSPDEHSAFFARIEKEVLSENGQRDA